MSWTLIQNHVSQRVIGLGICCDRCGMTGTMIPNEEDAKAFMSTQEITNSKMIEEGPEELETDEDLNELMELVQKTATEHGWKWEVEGRDAMCRDCQKRVIN